MTELLPLILALIEGAAPLLIKLLGSPDAAQTALSDAFLRGAARAVADAEAAAKLGQAPPA